MKEKISVTGVPKTMQIREKFLTENGPIYQIAKSAMDATYAENIEYSKENVLVIIEGLSMYLNEADVRQIFAIIINSMGVLLMLQSGSGISAISSVPYAFSEVFPKLSLGTWTYIFQGILVITLMVLKKRFVPSYLFSFVAGFIFGELMDINELWIAKLPLSIPLRIFYFVLSYIILCFGIALSNRCKLPIIPTDLFPRDLSEIIGKPYSKVKITFDVTCLIVTACLTYFALGKILGLGIGTVVAAFTMGKGVSIVGKLIDKKVAFVSVLHKELNEAI